MIAWRGRNTELEPIRAMQPAPGRNHTGVDFAASSPTMESRICWTTSFVRPRHATRGRPAVDRDRFDALIRSLALDRSRRGVIRGLSACSAGATLAALGVQQTAAACRDNGGKCKRDNDCCSGTCKGKKKRGKCRPAEGARGCTIDDPCHTVCPDDPAGFCAMTVAGKPFCFQIGSCFDCTSNEDCVDFSGNSGARRVRCPEACGAEFNFRECVVAGPP